MRISDWSSDVCSSDLSRSSGGASGALQEQIRQSALERYQQDFAALRAALDDDQREQWDAAVSALVGARRAPLYKLVDGQPQAVMVRIGAGAGPSTEIGRASWRERVCLSVSISVVAVSLKNKNTHNRNQPTSLPLMHK